MIAVFAAIIKVENKLLCCQRDEIKYKYITKKFEFPGGKVEKNETNEEALIREIKVNLLEISPDHAIKVFKQKYPKADDISVKQNLFKKS